MPRGLTDRAPQALSALVVELLRDGRPRSWEEHEALDRDEAVPPCVLPATLPLPLRSMLSRLLRSGCLLPRIPWPLQQPRPCPPLPSALTPPLMQDGSLHGLVPKGLDDQGFVVETQPHPRMEARMCLARGASRHRDGPEQG